MESILYLSAGRPSPVILDLCNKINKNKKLKLVYFDRAHEDLKLDKKLIDFDIKRIDVPFSSGLIIRILTLPFVYFKLFKLFRKNYPNTIIVESYDTLLLAFFFKRKIRNIVFYCRDLISLQWEKNIKAVLFQRLEKKLLQKVKSLLVTSPEFFNKYYYKHFKDFLLYENYPVKEISKIKVPSETTRISFIGIIRYLDSLIPVIKAIKKLTNEGYEIELNFFGGGLEKDIQKVKSLAKNNQFINLKGPFEYSKDIENIYSTTDISLAIYDSRSYNCKLAIPNKYYEAMMSNTFLLVSSETYLEEIVTSIGLGLGLNVSSEIEIQKKLRYLIENKEFQNLQLETSLNKVMENNIITINKIIQL